MLPHEGRGSEGKAKAFAFHSQVASGPQGPWPQMGFFCCCIQCVETGTLGILERFGSFQRILEPVSHHRIAVPHRSV
jgi:hypothetical protein